MPYTVEGTTVKRSDTGAVVKRHPNKAKALAHLRALKANVEAQEAEQRWLDEHAEEWLPSAEQLELSEQGTPPKVEGGGFVGPKKKKQQASPALKRAMRDAGVKEAAITESAKTAMYAVTPSPFSASRTSNWIARVGGLPPYIQNVAKGIMKSGKSESRAIASAIAVVKRWAAGIGNVSPEVRAAAAAAVAQWEAKRAASRARSAAKGAGRAVSRAAGSRSS